MKDPAAVKLGRKGGLKTAEKYKGKHSIWGKKGGRPRKHHAKK